MNVSVIGNGGWGTALALLLNGYGHKVTVWGASADYVEEIRFLGENPRYLPGVRIPSDILFTSDPGDAVADAECVVLASPSKYYASVCEIFKGLIIDDKTLVVSVTKGFDEIRHCRMSTLASEILGIRNVVVLSGPSHAEEVARNLPTCVVSACEDLRRAETVQRIFSGQTFRVYTGTDPSGTEIGGAIKNVIAVAVGVSDGMGFGDNSRAALVARGLAEMTRLGVAMGARAETFAGLSGIGDLVVTCTSRHSRNHAVGERLGKGEAIESIVSGMNMVAEGVWNSHIVNAISRSLDVEMPICSLVHQFCNEGVRPADAVNALMGRSFKKENY